ncbi:hypothetical protein Esi_0282_0020 [Ectocarpus siliculosus]|uniref:Uncharacterized protein n=1 Tax=Ectocarpus siliculosus TaxID=2880 RepID=D7FUY7_ECTSI|nr:hypothetical protein Esi_0282_0020 [Ectocarpus siliculosus]|eukprot:CBJ31793.1 hypothetical protein Esi_0282_0020 [Ectocarpus siliculosus]
MLGLASSGKAAIAKKPERDWRSFPLVRVAREDSGIDDDDANEEESSCALARKRALLRVRLARQRQSLATAAVDANERGLRAERRRRREEKLAALLMKARRDEDFCGSGAGSEDGSICGGRRSASGYYPGRYRRPKDNKRDEFPQRRCGSRRLGSVGGMRRSDSAEKRCMEALVGHRQEAPAGQEDDDEDRVPRQPLKVTPVAAACGSRSGYWRVGDRKEEEAREDEGGRSFGGGGRGGDASVVKRVTSGCTWCSKRVDFGIERRLNLAKKLTEPVMIATQSG